MTRLGRLFLSVALITPLPCSFVLGSALYQGTWLAALLLASAVFGMLALPVPLLRDEGARLVVDYRIFQRQQCVSRGVVTAIGLGVLVLAGAVQMALIQATALGVVPPSFRTIPMTLVLVLVVGLALCENREMLLIQAACGVPMVALSPYRVYLVHTGRRDCLFLGKKPPAVDYPVATVEILPGLLLDRGPTL